MGKNQTSVFISYLISGVFLVLGFYKMWVYESGYGGINVYVGGDAYNYIINANYATGYFVLAIFFALIGMMFYLSGFLSEIRDHTAHKQEIAPVDAEDLPAL